MRWLETRQNFNRRTSLVSLNTKKKPSCCTHCRHYKSLLGLIIYQVQRFEFSSCFLWTRLHIVNEGEDERAVLDVQVRGGAQLVSLQISELLLSSKFAVWLVRLAGTLWVVLFLLFSKHLDLAAARIRYIIRVRNVKGGGSSESGSKN